MKDAGAHAQAQTVADAGAWFFNVATSVLIVFVNKVLMDSKAGYKFTFGKCHWPCERCMQPVGPCLPLFCLAAAAATTLCALHFLSAAAFVTITQLLGLASKATVPWKGALSVTPRPHHPCTTPGGWGTQLQCCVHHDADCQQCAAADTYRCQLPPAEILQTSKFAMKAVPRCTCLRLTNAVCICACAVTLLFAVVANVSIASLNLSLLVNSVGFYQASVCREGLQQMGAASKNMHTGYSFLSARHGLV
jgi:hypothetical protein